MKHLKNKWTQPSLGLKDTGEPIKKTSAPPLRPQSLTTPEMARINALAAKVAKNLG